MNLSRFRHLLYRSGSALGDLSAASRGPSALGKRVVRKRVTAKANGALRRGMRGFGL